ncbi:Proteasomal ATPase-associated factor 1 [Stylophora pistillata]|uniref:Proteasomal ATPase-associated factor 1 n=1 Tax=Stylophora pistillata TaxID=50429 RepID=A0A2B4SX88_STYPI|nr:Proteasomal ATPase-associated factor 1 [Stylophora pistillata]
MEGEINIFEIPRLNIQWDWKEALRNPCGKAWISCTRINLPTVYGELIRARNKEESVDNNTLSVEASEGFSVQNVSKTSLTLSFPEANCSSKFISPSTSFPKLHSKSVRCIDISPGGGLGVSSGDDSTLLVWETSTGVVRHNLQGHISDVNTCKFFPSGKVVLSGGADLRLKIWSAEDGSCPVTLKGHTGGVVDTAIVDRGRNILSCSRDGTVRLWDCGEAKCLAVVSSGDCPVNSCTLTQLQGMENTPESDNQCSEREVGTEGKLLILAKEDGFLEGVDVRNKEKTKRKQTKEMKQNEEKDVLHRQFEFLRYQVFQVKCSSAVNCCAFLSEYEAVGGTEDGSLWIVDVRSPSFPVGVFRRSSSPILSLSITGDHGFLASSRKRDCNTIYLPGNSDRKLDITGGDIISCGDITCEPLLI